MVLFGSVLSGTLCFLNLNTYFLSQVRGLFQICSQPLSLSSSSGTPVLYNVNINVVDVISDVSQTILTLSFFSPASVISIILPSSSLIYSSTIQSIIDSFWCFLLLLFVCFSCLLLSSSSLFCSLYFPALVKFLTSHSVCPNFSGLL